MWPTKETYMHWRTHFHRVITYVFGNKFGRSFLMTITFGILQLTLLNTFLRSCIGRAMLYGSVSSAYLMNQLCMDMNIVIDSFSLVQY
jgi:hypothetical protein